MNQRMSRLACYLIPPHRPLSPFYTGATLSRIHLGTRHENRPSTATCRIGAVLRLLATAHWDVLVKTPEPGYHLSDIRPWRWPRRVWQSTGTDGARADDLLTLLSGHKHRLALIVRQVF